MEEFSEFTDLSLYGPALPRSESPGVSEMEQITNEFESHEGEEGKFTERYKEIAGRSKNRFIKFLLYLIISDEEKHHAVTHSMVATLKGGLNWSKPEGAISGLADLGEEKDELLKLTEDFIRLEREGIREYKKLIKKTKSYYRGLFVLLLQIMIRDSEKHVAILSFLRQRLKEA